MDGEFYKALDHITANLTTALSHFAPRLSPVTLEYGRQKVVGMCDSTWWQFVSNQHFSDREAKFLLAAILKRPFPLCRVACVQYEVSKGGERYFKSVVCMNIVFCNVVCLMFCLGIKSKTQWDEKCRLHLACEAVCVSCNSDLVDKVDNQFDDFYDSPVEPCKCKDFNRARKEIGMLRRAFITKGDGNSIIIDDVPRVLAARSRATCALFLLLADFAFSYPARIERYKEFPIAKTRRAALCFLWCRAQNQSSSLALIDRHVALIIAKLIWSTREDKRGWWT